MKIRLGIIVGLSILSIVATAEPRELNGVKMEDHMRVGDPILVLNGMGLRFVRKIGFKIKVYVAGLYVVEKNKDSKALIKSSSQKYLKIEFLRGLKKDQLRDAWKKAFKKNCVASCKKDKAKLKKFNKAMVNVNKGQEFNIHFKSDGLTIDGIGKSKTKVNIKGSDFSKSMLAAFIGPHPPGEDFKKGLLGL